MRTNELLESDIWAPSVWADADSGQVTRTFIIGQQFRIQEIMFTHSLLPHIIAGPANINPLRYLLDGGAPPAHFEDSAAGLDDGHQHQGCDAGHYHVQLHVGPLSRLGGIIIFSLDVGGHCIRIKVRGAKYMNEGIQ